MSGIRIRKAWRCTVIGEAEGGIYYAPTAAKARYMAVSEGRDAGWDDLTFANIRVARAPRFDQRLPPRHPVADRLTQLQLDIIGHAYAGHGAPAGRQHHYGTSPGDMDLLRLAWEELLFTGPHAAAWSDTGIPGAPPRFVYFYLTALGVRVAAGEQELYPR